MERGKKAGEVVITIVLWALVEKKSGALVRNGSQMWQKWQSKVCMEDVYRRE